MSAYYIEVRTKTPEQPDCESAEVFPVDQLQFIDLENVNVCKFLNNKDVNAANAAVQFEVYDTATQKYWMTNLSFARTLPWEGQFTGMSLYDDPVVFKNDITLSADLLKKAAYGRIPWTQSKDLIIAQMLRNRTPDDLTNELSNTWGVKNREIFCST